MGFLKHDQWTTREMFKEKREEGAGLSRPTLESYTVSHLLHSISQSGLQSQARFKVVILSRIWSLGPSLETSHNRWKQR